MDLAPSGASRVSPWVCAQRALSGKGQEGSSEALDLSLDRSCAGCTESGSDEFGGPVPESLAGWLVSHLSEREPGAAGQVSSQYRRKPVILPAGGQTRRQPRLDLCRGSPRCLWSPRERRRNGPSGTRRRRPVNFSEGPETGRCGLVGSLSSSGITAKRIQPYHPGQRRTRTLPPARCRRMASKHCRRWVGKRSSQHRGGQRYVLPMCASPAGAGAARRT